MSKRFGTDVFWLSFESGMDCFEFHHWQSGQHIRSLVYGIEEERTWERADGQPEEWEHQLFFHPKNLECILKHEKDERQRMLFQRAYKNGTVQVGKTEPSISCKETADAIAQHYGFPFFGLE